MNLLISISVVLCLLSIIYLIVQQNKHSVKIDSLSKENIKFLESIEKYVEIFNEQNVNKLLENKSLTDETLASDKINSIRKDYTRKLYSVNEALTEEHEMLIDFVTLTLSLLIKTPPNLRERLILENTDNEIIRKILLAKLESIQNHFIPVSLIEIAISKESN